MNPRLILIMLSAAALAGAQSMERRAVMTGGGSPEFGRCTGEVIVDGAAEINIRGDMATLRDLSGRAPEWRTFECTGPMPTAGAEIRFRGEGRGNQRLVSNPAYNNGVAVVRIEDPDPGANVYRFELSWRNASPAMSTPPMSGRFGADQAMQVCQDSIRQQAMERFGARQVNFRRINMDDNPGRNDRVVGTIEIRRPDGDEEHRRFSCSVNFQSGRVRSANIEDAEGFRGGGAERDMTARAMENCRQAISDRMRNEGYGRVDFGDMNMGSRGGNDWITGTARARGGSFPQSFNFSCSVRDGYIQSTDVRRR